MTATDLRHSGETLVADLQRNEIWPQEALENVATCPVCGSPHRQILHQGLRNMSKASTPGEWDMYRCQECGCGYLHPRPTPQAIGRAYSTYFTHKNHRDYAELPWQRRFQRILANGYRNHRYGTRLRPASRLGILVAKLLPDYRACVDGAMRHLPRAQPGQKLLDVGCGNGAFMLYAQSAGWQVVGVDPDPNAVQIARSCGLEVHQGTIEVLDSWTETFDAVTLSHVIEHVHDPVATLEACRRLLKPGGWIWLSTPNLDSQGHNLYGRIWTGLEPPRHLVIFTYAALHSLLQDVGFSNIEDQPYVPLCRMMFLSAERRLQGNTRLSPMNRLRLHLRIRTAERRAKMDPSVREFVTVRARKAC